MARRPEIRFLLVFAAILTVSFTVVALRPVNDSLVVPATAGVARMAGLALRVLGEDITVAGCDLRSPRFAVTIYNGCNGLIASLIFISGVLAFPASWRWKTVGVVLGLLSIQAVNLLRIIALYYVGVHLPASFDEAHVVVWQSIVILFGVAVWVLWARATSPQRDAGSRS